jgi:hypothetical protein
MYDHNTVIQHNRVGHIYAWRRCPKRSENWSWTFKNHAKPDSDWLKTADVYVIEQSTEKTCTIINNYQFCAIFYSNLLENDPCSWSHNFLRVQAIKNIKFPFVLVYGHPISTTIGNGHKTTIIFPTIFPVLWACVERRLNMLFYIVYDCLRPPFSRI